MGTIVSGMLTDRFAHKIMGLANPFETNALEPNAPSLSP